MRKLGLWAVRPKRSTSKPHPAHKIYPYLEATAHKSLDIAGGDSSTGDPGSCPDHRIECLDGFTRPLAKHNDVRMASGNRTIKRQDGNGVVAVGSRLRGMGFGLPISRAGRWWSQTALRTSGDDHSPPYEAASSAVSSIGMSCDGREPAARHYRNPSPAWLRNSSASRT